MAQLQHAQILVVDAQADCRELLAFVLTDAGAEVTTAQSAPEAIEVLTQRLPDLVLCSLAMPCMSGYDLLQHIRSLPQQALQPLPLIALSATAEPLARQQALTAGFAHYLIKPFDLEAVICAVTQLLPSTDDETAVTWADDNSGRSCHSTDHALSRQLRSQLSARQCSTFSLCR